MKPDTLRFHFCIQLCLSTVLSQLMHYIESTIALKNVYYGSQIFFKHLLWLTLLVLPINHHKCNIEKFIPYKN